MIWYKTRTKVYPNRKIETNIVNRVESKMKPEKEISETDKYKQIIEYFNTHSNAVKHCSNWREKENTNDQNS